MPFMWEEDLKMTNDVKIKIELLKTVLIDTLEPVKKLIDENNLRNKPLKLNFTTRVSTKLSECLRKYRPMTYNEALVLDYETIEQHFIAFMELISYINEYCVLPPNKQHFCALLQITNNQYLALQKGENPEIVSLMESIEDYFVGETFTSSQSGEVKEKSTLTRLKAKGQGHALQENKAIDTIIINNKFNIPASEMQKRLENLSGFLNGGNKQIK